MFHKKISVELHGVSKEQAIAAISKSQVDHTLEKHIELWDTLLLLEPRFKGMSCHFSYDTVKKTLHLREGTYTNYWCKYTLI